MIAWEGKRYDIETLSIDRVPYKKHFYGKIRNAENEHQKLVTDLFLTLVNKPKQPLHARNSFENKVFFDETKNIFYGFCKAIIWCKNEK